MLSCFQVFSQIFPVVNTPIDSIDTGAKTQSLNIKAKDDAKKITPSTTFKAPEFDSKLNEKALRNLEPEKSNKNFMNQYERDNRGVKTINYFNGSDYEKPKTTQYLGKINVETKKVTIEFRDFGLVDGDQIKVFLNDNPKSQHVNLKGYLISLSLELNEGYNKINIQALNQGIYGPNTAEIRVYDDHGVLITTSNWGLLNGQVATMVILKN